MRLYDSNIPSGNSYKVHLLLNQLGLTYQTVELDILASPSETRTPAFLEKNLNGRIPVLELADGRCLPESNAILAFLADGTPFVSAEPFERAQTLQWMFFEQYSHEPYVAVLKYWTYWGGIQNLSAEMLDRVKTRGQAALDVMERHLQGKHFFVAERYGIADIALFAYTQSAGALGFSLGDNVQAWLARVKSQPGYVPIKRDPLGKSP
jgi:glutathione S-transferase